MAREKWLKIRVSDQELADIKKRVGAHDMSNYVRGLVLDQPVAAPEPKTKKLCTVPILNWYAPLIVLASTSTKSLNKPIPSCKLITQC